MVDELSTATSAETAAPFEAFLDRVEPRLKQALVARYGTTDGMEATSEALAYSWEHWDTVKEMDQPVAYLYRVGQSRTRRIRRRTPVLPHVESSRMPHVEPALPAAMARLPENQRVAVALIHGLGWTQQEVADLLGVKRTTVQNHLDRGVRSIQRALGVNDA